VAQLDGQMRKERPNICGENGMPFWPRTITVYAQWVPFDKNDVCDMAWFDRLRKDSNCNQGVQQKPMLELTADWIFRNVRKFDHRHVKRSYLTKLITLGKDSWASRVTKRINAIAEPEANRCWLSAQLQCFGGRHSTFVTNADNSTSYGWRDSTLVCVLDCFHSSSTKGRTEDWQKANDDEGNGPDGKFSKQGRRVLWGSYGSFDLDASWSYYYEDWAKYERLREARWAADLDGVFTPNTFYVKK
jgi:hypothetical protein